jgi:hypothetical protein
MRRLAPIGVTDSRTSNLGAGGEVILLLKVSYLPAFEAQLTALTPLPGLFGDSCHFLFAALLPANHMNLLIKINFKS